MPYYFDDSDYEPTIPIFTKPPVPTAPTIPSTPPTAPSPTPSHPVYLAPEAGGFPSDEDSNNPRQLTVAADGDIIPIIYGRVQAKGKVFAANLHTDDFWYIGILWCMGEIGGISAVYFGEDLVPEEDLQHHLGTVNQVADTWLAAAIDGYDDELIITINGETRGVAYTVIKLSEEDMTTQFTATIEGMIVCDYVGEPGESGGDPDPPTNPPDDPPYPAGTFVTEWRFDQWAFDDWEDYDGDGRFYFPALDSLIGGGPPVFTIDWGDGSPAENVTAAWPGHLYETQGFYTIIVDGYCPRFKCGWYETEERPPYDNFPSNYISNIKQWGDVGFENCEGAFIWQFNSLKYITAVDGATSDTFSNVTSMYYAFHDANWLTHIDTSNWDVSNVTDFSYCFLRSHHMQFLDVSNWDVSSGITFNGMFSGCGSYSQYDPTNPIPIPTISVGAWNMANATDLTEMFKNSIVIVDGIENAYMPNVTDITSMFESFDGQIPGIENWDVSGITSFNKLFYNAGNYGAYCNPDVSNWDTSSLTNMYYLFRGAETADADCSNWDISNVTSMTYAFYECNMSTETYTNILKNWSLQSVQPGISVYFRNDATGNVPYYASAQAARDILTNPPNNWSITDGGSIPDAP